MAVAERPEAHVNLSAFYLRQGRTDEAEAALRTALRLDPRSVPARVNLADVYRMLGRDADGEPLLAEAVRLDPRAAEAAHALGLLYIRRERREEAMPLLERAYTLLPDIPRYGYVYAVALHDAGRADDAVSVLTAVHNARPSDVDTLAALSTFERDRGNLRAAVGWAERLAALRPDDPGAKILLAQLQNAAAELLRTSPPGARK
jgi:Flp pilus assembly protein TadD